MEPTQEDNRSKKSIPLIIVSVIVIALVVVLLITQTGKPKEPVALILENYNSISNGVVQYGDTLTLNSSGYMVINLMSGEYALKYNLKQCNNPSEKFDYTRTSPSGEEISYDPLKEEVVLTSDGKFQKRMLSESEQINALLREEVYVLETEGTEPVHHKAILESDSVGFSANGQTKFLFRAKCDDSSIVLKLYKTG